MNEAITQWLTTQTCATSGRFYGEHVRIVEEVANRIGPDHLIESFTRTGHDALVQLLEAAEEGYAPKVEQRLKDAQTRLERGEPPIANP